jgi:hypothetical protein
MKNYEEKLIYKDLENQVKIEFSPKVERYGIDENDLILAELFSSLKSFYDFIERTRKKIGINQPITYSEKGIRDVLKNLNNEQKKALNDEVQLFLRKYKLPQKWEYSLISAVLTHILLVPPIKEEIGLYLPNHIYDLVFFEDKKGIDELIEKLTHELVKTEIRNDLLSHPAIFFKREVSLNELIKWLRKNWKYLKVYFSLLPKKRSFKDHRNNIFYGQLVWIYREEGLRWCDIEKLINDQKKFPEIAKFRFSQIEIRKLYYKYIKLLKKIEQTSFKL